MRSVRRLSIALVAGGRPNFMKIAPLSHALAARDILSGRGKKGRVPPPWDGRAAERIAGLLLSAWRRR